MFFFFFFLLIFKSYIYLYNLPPSTSLPSSLSTTHSLCLSCLFFFFNFPCRQPKFLFKQTNKTSSHTHTLLATLLLFNVFSINNAQQKSQGLPFFLDIYKIKWMRRRKGVMFIIIIIIINEKQSNWKLINSLQQIIMIYLRSYLLMKWHRLVFIQ